MRIVGFSAFIGSWKIIEASRPRMSRRSASLAPSTSRPSSRIWPWLTRMAPSGRSRMRDMAVTDLPEPDSPTNPTISPGATSMLTPASAGITPR